MSKYSYEKEMLKKREKLIELTLEERKEIIDIYNKASEDVLKRLKSVKKGSMKERYLKELDKSLKNYKKKLNIELEKAIREYMRKAANLGISPTKEYFKNMQIPMTLKNSFSSMFTNLSPSVVRVIASGELYKDGKSLSSRIWNITNKNGNDIKAIIQNALIEQKNASDLAKELEKYIKSGVGTKQKTYVKGINRDISYEAVRLARTCMAHAMNEGSVQASMNNPFSKGLKWNLSSEHVPRLSKFGKTRDICDDYAEQNRYDLGTGVFPAKEYPIGHPNCLCYSCEIVEDIEKSSDEIIRWINGESNKKLDNWARRNGFEI